MAKKFADIYKKYNTTVYKDMNNLLVVLAKMNSAVNIKEDLAPNGAKDGSTSKFTLQRRVRNVVKTVANPNSGKTADALALLDSFEKANWESTELVTGVAKTIGWIKTIADKFDMDKLNSKDADNVGMQVAEIALDRNKTIWAAIDGKAKTNAAAYKVTLPDGTQSADITVPSLPAYAKDEVKIWDAIANGAVAFSEINDKFKAKSRAVIIISQIVGIELTKEMGTAFNQEKAIAQTGFKTGYSINGNPVIIDQELTGRKVYFIDEEALVFKKSPSMADVDQNLGTNHYVGKVFYDVIDVADENRVWKLLPAVIK